MKKIISLLILLIFLANCFEPIIFGESLIYVKTERNQTKLTDDEIVKIKNHFLKDIINQLSKKNYTISTKNTNLYDFQGNVIAIATPIIDNFNNINGYVIIDKRRCGYGVCESSLDVETAHKIFNTNLKITYKFPSTFITETELANFINKNFNQKNESQISLPISKNAVSNTINTTNTISPNISTLALSSTEIVELKGNPAYTFVPISQNGIISYGGNQSWFSTPDLINKGCGTVAIANIAWHMAKYNTKYSKLYTYTAIDKSTFTKHMNDVAAYVIPGIIGIPSVNQLDSKFLAFAKSRGINLTSTRLEANFNIDQTSSFIKTGLSQNAPIAMLQSYDSDFSNFNWHWMTITRYLRYISSDERYIEISSWGNHYTLNLKLLVDAVPNDYIYFK